MTLKIWFGKCPDIRKQLINKAVLTDVGLDEQTRLLKEAEKECETCRIKCEKKKWAIFGGVK